MQQGSFNINDYFPGGNADIGRIERDSQSGIFSLSQLNQIIDRLTREIGDLRNDLSTTRDDLKKSNRLNKILGAITVIGIIIGIIGVILYFL